jgi:uncharacterized membrane protein
MANYTIIGGDLKEYGPITADDVRLWIGENRLNGQSMVKVEGENEFRALETFPEFAAAFIANQPLPKLPRSAFAIGGTSVPTDYSLDIGGCITRGWGLVKIHFGILFASLLVVIVVAFAFFGTLGFATALIIPKHLMSVPLFKVIFNLLMSGVSALVLGPLSGGLYLVYLRTIRGEATGVGDVFAGFQKSFLPLFLGYLVVVMATGLCTAPFSYLTELRLEPLLSRMQNASPTDIQTLMPQVVEKLVSLLPLMLICLIPVTYLTVNWMFTQALILDKELDFWPAMKVSWKMVHKHWWHVFGLVVVTGLLNVAGFFCCCVGLVFTIPIGFAALMFAYETIFAEGPSA